MKLPGRKHIINHLNNQAMRISTAEDREKPASIIRSLKDKGYSGKYPMLPIDITGNKAEQLIACMILANVELQQGHIENGRKLIQDTLNLAQRLEEHGAIYRAAQVSKFACFTYDVTGTQELLFLPIINGNLIVPAINLQEIVTLIKSAIPKVVQLIDVTIVYFKLCLNTKKLIAALRDADNISTSEELIIAIGNVLENSMAHEFHSSDFLGIAEDYFMLARNMLVKGNSALTLIALRNANKALTAYGAAESTGTQVERIKKLKMELRTISNKIK